MASHDAPKQINALTVENKIPAVRAITLPPMHPTRLTVKVNCVALNPTDWKHIAYGLAGDALVMVGCDFSGTVVAIGDEVTKQFKVGDQVFGCAHGSNASGPYDGVFAEYALVKGDTTMKVPAGLTMEEASTIPLGCVTVGQGLFQPNKGLNLPLPGEGKGNGEWVLIYGGSTATGSLGIQYAKLAGFKVITTCSLRHQEFVKSRGADEIFDYTDPECGAKIRALTKNGLKYAWDTVGEDATSKICGEALSSDGEGCHYGTILRNQSPRKDIKYTSTLMYTVFGEEFTIAGQHVPALSEDFEFARSWTILTESLIADGKIKAHPASVREGGLEGILKGLDEMKEGKVRGEKLVYRI